MSQANPTDAQIDAYAHHYVIHGIQTEAWRQAFPDNKAKPETQHVKASEFHSLDKVQIRIAELREIAREQSVEEFGIDALQIKKMLTLAAKRGLSTIKDHRDNQVPTNIGGAVSALAEINRMDGNHAAHRIALGGDPDGLPLEQVITVVYENEPDD